MATETAPTRHAPAIVTASRPRLRSRALFAALAASMGCGLPPEPNRPAGAATASATVLEATPPGLGGLLIDPEGEPVEGAVVTATSTLDWSGEGPTAEFALTDARGEFRFEGLPNGVYRLNAASAQGWSSLGSAIEHSEDRPTPATLVFERAGFVVRGVVRDENAEPIAGAKVEALPLLPTDAGPAFGAITDGHGEYAMSLPSESAFLLVGTSEGRRRAYARADASTTRADLELSAKPVRRPDDAALSAWLAADALTLATDDPKHALDDLLPVARWIGDASVVGLGEATHGTSEFFRIKHRLVELLVTKLGFSVIAFECGTVEARVVDRYVHTGSGDPVDVVRKLGTDPYATEEVVAFVRWMRRYNEDPRHAKKLTFAGFDATSWTSAAALRAYLRRVNHADSATDAAIARLESVHADSTYAALAPKLHEETRAALAHVGAWLTQERVVLAATAGEAAWTEAVDHTARLARLERSFLDPTLRDADMAEEVERIREAHPGERVALWLHNAHGSAWPRAFDHMGARLRERHGATYVSVGFTFGAGSFRALTRDDMSAGPIAQHLAGPAIDSFDGALTLAAPDLFAIDLRKAKGDIRRWLSAPAVVSEVGFVFGGETSARRWTVPARAYDVVVHVDRTQAAIGLEASAQSTRPGGKRSP